MLEPCARCEALEQEIAEARRELAAAGRELPPMQSTDDNDLERELAHWLSSTHKPGAAAGYRAGWRRFGQLAAPRIRDWERLWWKAKREGQQPSVSGGRATQRSFEAER